MKKLLAYSLFLLGFFCSETRAASFTHYLTYTNDDNENTAELSATVSFETTSGFSNADTSDVRGDSIQNGFTTIITYINQSQTTNNFIGSGQFFLLLYKLF